MRRCLAWAVVLACTGCEFRVRGVDLGVAAGDLGGAIDLGPAGPDLAPPPFTLLSSQTSVDLHGVWGSGPNEVFAVGKSGVILRSIDRGQTWVQAVSQTTGDFYAVWGSAPSTAWAIGGQVVRQTNDGTSWSLKPSLPAASVAIWGSAQNDIWVTGTGYQIHHSINQAASWMTAQPIGSADAFNAVWGASATDIFVAGNYKILHSNNGTVWTTEYSGPAKILGLGGSGLAVLAVGANGVAMRATAGGSWTPLATGYTGTLWSVWVSGNEAWVAADGGLTLHTTNAGASWARIPTGTTAQLRGVWGASPNDVYFVGSGGTILHYP